MCRSLLLNRRLKKGDQKCSFLNSNCNRQFFFFFFYESCTCFEETHVLLWRFMPTNLIALKHQRGAFAPLSRPTVMVVSCCLWFVTVLTCWVWGRGSPGTAHLFDWRHRVCTTELAIVSAPQGAQVVQKATVQNRKGGLCFCSCYDR